MICFTGYRSHGRRWRPGSANVVGGGMARMESWRLCRDVSGTESIAVPKVGSQRHRETGTRVDSRLALYQNNCKSWITVMITWLCTQRDSWGNLELFGQYNPLPNYAINRPPWDPSRGRWMHLLPISLVSLSLFWAFASLHLHIYSISTVFRVRALGLESQQEGKSELDECLGFNCCIRFFIDHITNDG
jgi:hypothetical protein